MAGCSNDGIQKIGSEEVTSGSLKLHRDGTLVKDIPLMEETELLEASVEAYNDAEFIRSEEDDEENPIMTDGPLEETLSASYFSMNVESAGNEYYIGYKADDTFKVIASGDDFDQPLEYFIESEDLTEIMKGKEER